jgi:hypothetical protein
MSKMPFATVLLADTAMINNTIHVIPSKGPTTFRGGNRYLFTCSPPPHWSDSVSVHLRVFYSEKDGRTLGLTGDLIVSGVVLCAKCDEVCISGKLDRGAAHASFRDDISHRDHDARFGRINSRCTDYRDDDPPVRCAAGVRCFQLSVQSSREEFAGEPSRTNARHASGRGVILPEALSKHELPVPLTVAQT